MGFGWLLDVAACAMGGWLGWVAARVVFAERPSRLSMLGCSAVVAVLVAGTLVLAKEPLAPMVFRYMIAGCGIGVAAGSVREWVRWARNRRQPVRPPSALDFAGPQGW